MAIGTAASTKDATLTAVKVVLPYDFRLSVQLTRSFDGEAETRDPAYRFAARIDGNPTLVTVRGGISQEQLNVTCRPQCDGTQLRLLVARVVNAGLALAPFYDAALKDARLAQIAKQLNGLKPFRPVSLFEMAVSAITEQQISTTAARKIRQRVVERFGECIDDLWVFPEPQVLAAAPLEALLTSGLSHRKAEYITAFARNVAAGNVDLDAFEELPDDRVREIMMEQRGFGPWSAAYLLIRGLARPDSVPVDDLGLQRVVGHYLGTGNRLTAQGVARKLAPFKPYRGLAAFYLIAAWRLGVKPA